LYTLPISFFLSWVSKTRPNHWNKRMASTRLAEGFFFFGVGVGCQFFLPRIRVSRVANPRAQAFLCGPNGGFWPDDFSKKDSPLCSISCSNNVRWYRRSAAPAAAMPKVYEYLRAAVFLYTCHGSCALEHTLYQDLSSVGLSVPGQRVVTFIHMHAKN